MGCYKREYESARLGSRKTESKPRPGKEQDFGLSRINCPYFVPSITKLARGSKDFGDLITLSTRHLGIVSLNILSMACIGTWSFLLCHIGLAKWVGLW
ncbi:hypothetical protein F383_28233 [Gossypium arboreum]|uniref:Uncharacterized protein n=1 Tax=Gossypium arboreum TaxID=29729 RepID=A0A0B0MS95_GOSAR|nr:hypothetical protein F383_28233 [Gossypium arboreum]